MVSNPQKDGGPPSPGPPSFLCPSCGHSLTDISHLPPNLESYPLCPLCYKNLVDLITKATNYSIPGFAPSKNARKLQ